MSLEEVTHPCQICGGPLGIAFRGWAGYACDLTFDILNCRSCNTSVAVPLDDHPEIYSAIYSNPRLVPGYSRYEKYAQIVATHRESTALDELARREDIYWGISKALDRFPRAGLRVLDYGCGLGYITAALRGKGLDAIGMEESDKALDSAIARFGQYFTKLPAANTWQGHLGKFDVVVLAEVIEHVRDPLGLLKKLLGVLSPIGTIFLTTPNKSFYDYSCVWSTEFPPIHHWWFSEESIRRMASRLGLEVELIDFRGFSRRHPVPLRKARRPSSTRSPAILVDGQVRSNEFVLTRWLRATRLLDPLSNARDAWRAFVLSRVFSKSYALGERRCHLCAILRPRESVAPGVPTNR